MRIKATNHIRCQNQHHVPPSPGFLDYIMIIINKFFPFHIVSPIFKFRMQINWAVVFGASL